MRNILYSLVLLLPLTVVACTTDKVPDQDKPQVPVKQAEPVAKAVVHDVKCGCSIEGVGSCGNYILIDGKYVPMIHASLGKMEWCAQKDKGAKVETVGAMKDGKFIAESWKTVE
jgi:hypothetical protein